MASTAEVDFWTSRDVREVVHSHLNYVVDPLEEVKTAAAKRWVAAVNADGSYGRWRYGIAKRIADVAAIVTAAVRA